jgi:hypothetical protein
MRKELLLLVKTGLVSILLGINQMVCAQKFEKAIDYMNYISTEQKKISKDMWSYTSAIAHGGKARKIDNKRKELIETVSEAKKKIQKMPDFNGDKAYRDSTVSYLTISYIVLSEDYSKIVDMEEIAEQSYDKMEAYMTAEQIANDKLDLSGDMIDNEQKNFATQNKITLTNDKDKLGKNLEKAGEVFKYYNVLYLIFFKSYKQEMYLLEALQKNDVNALEQNKNSLISFSTEGISKLLPIKSFKNDLSIKTACQKTLAFYKKEATEKVGFMRDFILKSDNFKKEQAAFEATKSHSNQEITTFNKSVNDHNTALATFNKMNTDLSNERNLLLNGWNTSVQNFLDRQIPTK